MVRSRKPDPNVLAPRIISAVNVVQLAQERLASAIIEVQRSCEHRVVAQTVPHLDIGEASRICMRCRMHDKGAVTRGGGWVPYLSSKLGGRERIVLRVSRGTFNSLLVEWSKMIGTPVVRVD